MSEKRLAFFYRDLYYLVPDQYKSFEDFLISVDRNSTISVRLLTENNRIPYSNIEKGVCISPYFYSEYGYAETEIIIRDPSDVFPVEVELFSQKEYNEKLRGVVLNYCPGCLRYKPISNRTQSLNGHFKEISLNSVCFYRQDYKPSPRVFRLNLYGLGWHWYHFDPAERKPEDVLDSIKSMTYIKYDAACRTESESPQLHVAFKPDFFVQALTEVLSGFIENTLDFTTFRITFDRRILINDEEFKKQIDDRNREAFQKNCKKYGVALAELTYESAFDEKIGRSLEPLCKSSYISIICKENNRVALLLLDECGFMKQLHFRAPLFEAASAKIKIFDQYGEKQYRISFGMEQETAP